MTLQRPALIGRKLDFWLLGGASVLAWFFFFTTEALRNKYGFIGRQFTNLAFLANSLSLIVNYPHFMASYKLAYTRGSGFLRRYWFQLICVPTVLIIFLMVFIYPQFTNVESLDQGKRLLSGLGKLMFLTVGWHYTKQAFGCMMVYAKFDNYVLTKWQRNIIRYTLLSIWWADFLRTENWHLPLRFEFVNWQVELPGWSFLVANSLLSVGLFCTIYFVFGKNYLREQKLPSLNFIIPGLAMFLWWAPSTHQEDFYMSITPFFHSLQYLVFIYAFERQAPEAKTHPMRLTWISLALCAVGWLSFEIAPELLDSSRLTSVIPGSLFFMTAFNIFINIHHYFIDNSLWRFDSSELRQRILDPRSA